MRIRSYGEKAGAVTVIAALTLLTAGGVAKESFSEQESDEAIAIVGEMIIPPAPLIVKMGDKNSWIPEVESKYRPEPKEERNAVATTAKVGSSFGYRRDPFTRRERFHAGIDIKAPSGAPVGASLGGVVEYAGWYHGYGNVVIVSHGGGVATHYAQLSAFAAEVGEEVRRGTVIGYVGSTGRATSPHLHYEVRLAGNPVNPLKAIELEADSEFFTWQRMWHSPFDPTRARVVTPLPNRGGEPRPAGVMSSFTTGTRPRRVGTRAK
jgi:murein DD-endopeptidase MepM/ murein hydrolase activator NlpD